MQHTYSFQQTVQYVINIIFIKKSLQVNLDYLSSNIYRCNDHLN